MHSIPASAFLLSAESGATGAKSSRLVLVPAKLPFARAHLSKNPRMSVPRSRITGRLRSGAITSLFPRATLSTWVRQVQRGTPFTLIAHEPHMPTRQAQPEASVASRGRWDDDNTAGTRWLGGGGTSEELQGASPPPLPA